MPLKGFNNEVAKQRPLCYFVRPDVILISGKGELRTFCRTAGRN
jgi:hypothetical protein